MTTPTATLTRQIFSSASTDHNVVMPAVVGAGDLLVIGFTSYNGPPTTPSGWTQLHSTANSFNIQQTVYAKKAIGNEDGTNVNIVTSSSMVGVAHLYHVPAAEWHGTTMPEVGTASTGNSVSPNPPSLSPSWGAADTLWLVFTTAYGPAFPTVTAYPTSYTNGAYDLQGTGNGATMLGSARRGNNTATEDPAAFTISPDTLWIAQTVAIRPAPDPVSGGSTAQVNISASGDGQLIPAEGSAATVNVSATGAGQVIPTGGSTATVNVSAEGSGELVPDELGGSTVTVEVSALGGGFEVVQEGSEAVVTVGAFGAGFMTISSGSTATVNVSASGAGTVHGPAIMIETGSWLSYRKLN